MTDSHSEALAYLTELHEQQRERYRPQKKPPEASRVRNATVSIPAVGMQFARSDIEAAHRMVGAIGEMQSQHSLSTSLLGGVR